MSRSTGMSKLFFENDIHCLKFSVKCKRFESFLFFLFIIRYSCEDPNCYFDLSRLRGLKYFTWEKKDKMIQEDEVNALDLQA